MNTFEYAQPKNLGQLMELLSSAPGKSELLGGGTDLVGLMKKMIVTPERVVNICDVAEMQGIERNRDGTAETLVIGAAVHLDELLASPLTEPLDALRQAIHGTASIQFQAQATLGGELCRRPRCWYFRDGHGLLAKNGTLVEQGDNRYHAILGNTGPAKFVNASRLAPALIALGANARIVGPKATDHREIPLEEFYVSPRREGQRENILKPNHVLSHVVVPLDQHISSATYEVRHGEGPDDPLAVAAAAVSQSGGVVRIAKTVLGHVAPIPWISEEAARELIGQSITDYTAEAAGRAAVARATPLKDNEYKVQLANVAVRRAILQAARLPTGGIYA